MTQTIADNILVDTKQKRGQFFTKSNRVGIVMKSLMQNTGKLLEPSAGAGHLVLCAEENQKHSIIDAIELDNTLGMVCKTPITYGDFFSFADDREAHYNTILGNPPYVAWKAVEETTRKTATNVKEKYSDKANIYYLFMDRCIDLLADEGEIVFIVPKEWLYTSSAKPLREKMLKMGAITHLIDCGEEKLFEDADVPALLIFRYQLGKQDKMVKVAESLKDAEENKYVEKTLIADDHRFMLVTKNTAKVIKNWGKLSDSYRVRVGMVSGADNIFRIKEETSLEDSVVREYLTTKGVEKFIDVNHINSWKDMPPKAAAYLLQYKKELLSRRIAKFDETNWWKYGAIRNIEYMKNNNIPRFYTYAKTRNPRPFFEEDKTNYYGGGMLGLFKVGKVSKKLAIRILNSPPYREILEAMFLTTGNKISLQPSTLEDAPFPTTDEEATKFLEQKF